MDRYVHQKRLEYMALKREPNEQPLFCMSSILKVAEEAKMGEVNHKSMIAYKVLTSMRQEDYYEEDEDEEEEEKDKEEEEDDNKEKDDDKCDSDKDTAEDKEEDMNMDMRVIMTPSVNNE